MKKLRLGLVALALVAVAALVLQKRSRSRSTPVQASGAPSRSGGSGGSGGSGNGNGTGTGNGTGLPPVEAQPRERRAQSDPAALKALMAGSSNRVGVDLAKLKALGAPSHKPLTEYLNYIQVQRGGGESLLFVRMKDIDELAKLAGQTPDEFTRQFRKIGVLLSMN